jgi:hypothetical protein
MRRLKGYLVTERSYKNGEGAHFVRPVEDLGKVLRRNAVALEVGVGQDDDERLVVVVGRLRIVTPHRETP